MFSVPLICGISCAAAAEEYDVVLRGGQVIDGTGSPARQADVAIKDGLIVAVGEVARGSAAQEFDVSGYVVAPGFIDVHSHADSNIRRRPEAENYLRMGVTTLVTGNCGGSPVAIGAYFESLEENGIATNVATLVGHSAIRRRAMDGSFDRAPTAEELAEMRALTTRAMRDGALGLSTGLIYVPATYSETDELVELAKVAAEHGGIYVSHMRNEAAEIMGALEELFEIARKAEIPAQVSHIKLAGESNWGGAREVLDAIEEARSEGLEITQDQYVYTASSTGIGNRIPAWVRDSGRAAFRKRMQDPEVKTRVVREMKEAVAGNRTRDYSHAMIAFYRHDPSLNGLRIPEAAKKARGSDSLEDQIELILDIHANGGAQGVFHSMNEEDLQTFLQHPNTMFAADASVRNFGSGVPHPRGYGNNARVLGRYVRELGLLELEEAVRRMTSLPAETFRISRRGEIQEGFHADIVVFDPATVTDLATFEEPHQYATGFKHVFVNGSEVVRDDEHLGALPGMVLRRADAGTDTADQASE